MKKYSYMEWLSADEMHEDTKQWISELEFIRDEQLFLNSMIRSFTLQLVDSSLFQRSQKIIGQLQHAEKNIVPLFQKVEVHGQQLDIIVDGVDQLKMEKAYLETHHELQQATNDYIQNYRTVKKSLFEIFGAIMKNDERKKIQP